ncbi:hypothetical protein PVK06_025599 [Gossypium arboreum]|uniref:Tubby C-terminal domain-containing protein n=1 Tax=Gossypium arboreum TaxID=29729 RepID=A0ABR0PGX6_GOSAR|nr:hypothetical protein PVK06_025599 [Gossypium arboreum]
MDVDNIARSSSTYIGKLRSNFLRTKFIIYDTQPPYNNAQLSPPDIVETRDEEDEGKYKPLILRNRAPRWHEQLQCWGLNFWGRVTVASMKNLQLIAANQPAVGVPTPS